MPAIGPFTVGERPRVLHEQTPRPLIVSAIRSFGESGAPAAKEWNTVRNAAWSCPSQVATCSGAAGLLLAQVVEGDDLLDRPVRLDLGPVDNHPQVAETLLCCTLERLQFWPS